jgi:predicted flap endonuclease-1-like 5' DNA nuclease
MAWFAVQSLPALLLAFVIGIGVGWLIWARRRPAAPVETVDVDMVEEATCTCGVAEDDSTAPEPEADDVGTGPDIDDLAVARDADASATAQPSVDDVLADDPGPDTAVDAAVDDPDPSDDADDQPPAAVDEAPDAASACADAEALADVDETLDGPDAPEALADESEGAVVADDDVAAVAIAVGAMSEPGTSPAEVEAGPVPTGDVEAEVIELDEVEPDDDIERIEGIGPKIGRVLREAGLGTFTAIAQASPETLRAALKVGGVRLAPSLVSWPDQAQLLADGDEDGFRAFTDSLAAGRVKG